MRVLISHKFIVGFVMVIIAVIAVPHLFARIDVTGTLGEFGTIAAAILVGLLVGSFFSNGITRQFDEIRKSTERIGSGDLSEPVKLGHQLFVDETTDIAEGINYMLRSLQELAGHITGTALEVSTMAQSLSSSAQSMKASTQEITGGMESMSKGSAVQMEMVEKVNALIRRMAESAKAAAESAQGAAQSSDKARHTAESGVELSRNAITKLRGVFEQVEDAGKQVYSLEQRTRHIHKITEVITKIAQRTNLLALNATIEAARAGEYGRGFAVVAEEVRKLADNTGKSAEQIAGLLDEIEGESQAAVEKMREGCAGLDEGNEDMNTINRFLEEIQASVTDVAHRAGDIKSLTAEQAGDSSKLVVNADEIAKVAEENASATQQVTAATQEQMASMEEMALSAQDLLLMAEKLETVVSKFRVGR
ncbi:MAG: methyl-accepting chemotaxis protein [Deltaproteobacteria bacterium]|nr:methyl-accepting chemotaxis protein [Deltaproteobacteria bacterium]